MSLYKKRPCTHSQCKNACGGYDCRLCNGTGYCQRCHGNGHEPDSGKVTGPVHFSTVELHMLRQILEGVERLYAFNTSTVHTLRKKLNLPNLLTSSPQTRR